MVMLVDDNVTGQENILVKMTIPIPTPKSKRVARVPITKASKTKAGGDKGTNNKGRG